MGNPCETQDGRGTGGKRERAVPKPHGLMNDWAALAWKSEAVAEGFAARQRQRGTAGGSRRGYG